ncbi:HEPN domain-containing protein [Chryseolinea sp. T2]|uniref:HEPN domain-containing protein n=1 Tax=Chryseolinea sp. T2 TaxID=3129255 RepID=UPI0030774C47
MPKSKTSIDTTLKRLLTKKQITPQDVQEIVDAATERVDSFYFAANRISDAILTCLRLNKLLKPEFAEANKLKAEAIATIKNEAGKNAMVASVSAIEVFFKDLITENVDGWSSAGYDELLKDKITLYEAYHLFKHENLSRESIIAEHYNFSTIENIAATMDTLTGGGFYKKMMDTKVGNKGETFENTFLAGLRELYDLRNRIVHEHNKGIEISYEQALSLPTNALIFLLRVSAYIIEKTPF